MDEQDRGVFGYIVAGIIAYFINIFLSKTTTLTVAQTTFIAIYLIGNLIVYSFDILFAKKQFFIDGALQTIPYSELATRGYWLLHSFYQQFFFRFIVTVIIDTIVGLTILKFTIAYLDKLNILKDWKYRNYIVAFVIATLTYVLYLGTLRFRWAYQQKTPVYLDILVMAWVSISLLIYTAANQSFTQKDVAWRFFYANNKANDNL